MKKHFNFKKTAMVGAFSGALLGVAVAASAQTTLRIGDSLPSGHYIAEGLIEFWMDEVKDQLGDDIDFDHFPAEQLGKAGDMLSLAQTGVLDISYVGPSYVSDKMPLSAVAQLPGMFGNSCEGTLAYWELVKPGGLLYELEFEPNEVRPLMALALSPYQIYTAKKEIEGIDSFKGLKLRATGGAMEETVLNLDAVPVQMAAPDTRDALSRGTLDGLVFPNSSLPPYDLHGLLKYATDGVSLGSFVATYSISNERWASLSDKEREVFTQVGEAATKHACELVDELDAEDKEKVKAAGVTYVTLGEDDLEKLNQATSDTAKKWAEDLDKRNRKGTEVLKAYQNALEEYNNN